VKIIPKQRKNCGKFYNSVFRNSISGELLFRCLATALILLTFKVEIIPKQRKNCGKFYNSVFRNSISGKLLFRCLATANWDVVRFKSPIIIGVSMAPWNSVKLKHGISKIPCIKTLIIYDRILFYKNTEFWKFRVRFRGLELVYRIYGNKNYVNFRNSISGELLFRCLAAASILLPFKVV
jgi:hypothetical protein